MNCVGIPKWIEDELHRTENKIGRAGDKEARRWLVEVARPLLNTFQKRVTCQVEFTTVNGSFWMQAVHGSSKRDELRIRNLHQSIEMTALPTSPGLRPSKAKEYDARDGFDRRLMERFPELIKLYWIAYELDATSTRSGLPYFRPTVKPKRKFKR